MEKYIYRPVRFYLITFACTWFWWLFAILLNEGTILYLGMLLGLISPAVVAIVTVFTSKNKALINRRKVPCGVHSASNTFTEVSL